MAFVLRSPDMSMVPNIIFNPNPNPRQLTSFRNLRISEEFGQIGRTSMSVSCTMKDSGIRAPELDQGVWSYGKFSAPVKQGSRPSKDEEKQNYYLNMGYAIRTLREDFPEVFYRELNFDIYRDDIVFKDPLNTFVGIESYKSILWALRFHGRMFFQALWLDMVSVWQPFENVIMVRWTIHGIPRVPWESRGRFDGTSEYKLDKNGKIYEHKVDNIALNSPPKYRVLAVQELIEYLGCPSTARPTYFESSSSSSSSSS